MGLLNDPSQQDFFKKRWRQRVWRVKKKIIPVVFSCLFVCGLIMTFIQLLQIKFSHEGGNAMIFAHTFLAVVLGVAVVVLGDCLHLKRKSSFLPIRVIIRRRGRND